MVKDTNLDDLKILTEDKESYIKQAGIPEKNLFTADNANEIKNKHNALVEYATGFPTEEQIGEITKQVVASLSDDVKELLNSKEQVYDGNIGDFGTKSNLINYLVANVDKVVDVKLGYSEIAFMDNLLNIKHECVLSTNNFLFKNCFLDKTNNYLVFSFIGFITYTQTFDSKPSKVANFPISTHFYLVIDIKNDFAIYCYLKQYPNTNGGEMTKENSITINNNTVLFDNEPSSFLFSLNTLGNKEWMFDFDKLPVNEPIENETNIKIKYKNVEEIVD